MREQARIDAQQAAEMIFSKPLQGSIKVWPCDIFYKRQEEEEEKKPKIANKNIQGAAGRRSVMTMLLLKSNLL